MFSRRFLLCALSLFLCLDASASSQNSPILSKSHKPFSWKNATVYFLLTDRFHNGDKSNDFAYGRKADAAPLRGYMGGDLKGVIQKIREGYFQRLGVDAIWMTPPVEQIHSGTDEGTGKSYGFHGYWAWDFTRVDANLGSDADFKLLVKTAHHHGLRVLLDVVMNHTGPVTEQDPVWPSDWVRTQPRCDYKSADGAIKCTLVDNLPDFLTERDTEVVLPPHLMAKWKKEGRYEREVQELDAYFARTGYPRAPRYYLMKWHTDWIRRYGVDGFRADTVKHVEASVWKELKQEANMAYEDWKKAHPKEKLGEQKFFMVAEAYNYPVSDGLWFRMDGGTRVNYYANGFDSMINFGFKGDAQQDYEPLFASYSGYLQNELKDYSILSYISSHDDDHPFDAARVRPFEAATKLMLSPGAAQIYYGDELARRLDVAQAKGDARLRSPMDWTVLAKSRALPNDAAGRRYVDLLAHWQKLGQFRRAHLAVGAGIHQMLSRSPYVFKRSYQDPTTNDQVLVALDVALGKPLSLSVQAVFQDGEKVKDYYSGQTHIVNRGQITFSPQFSIVLLGKP